FSATDAESVTKPFVIDSVFPSIDLTSVSSVFSPNKDGFLDIFEILQKGSEEKEWQAKIIDDKNKVLWESYYAGRPKQKELWDGVDLNNNLQKNGLYKYTISSTDEAGNTTTKDLSIELKNIYTVAYVTLDDDKFSPNKDGKFDVIKFRPFVNVKEDLEVYKIEVMDKDKKVVKTFSGTKTIPEVIEWDGISEAKNVAKDGFYTLKLSTIYRFGNRPQVESAQFILDTTPPELNLTFEPQYFSPDDDGVDDELSIGIKSYDLSGIKDWKVNVLTPDKNKNFYSISGTGKPTEKMVWAGKGSNGELVDSAEDYPVKIYAVDNVGNVLEKEVDPVMVDILVIKLDDGRLKIKISNIEFKPESAEMTDSPKNEKILGLLVKALKKYNQYKILIEGHANKFRQNLDEARAKKLSDDRAKFILSILSKKGIAANRMSALGRGFDIPLVPLEEGVSADDLAKNRRVEFYLDKNQ
ncbi:MAG TPA: OmpA family protein, partial [Spirochaetota bacterium]|nr:OmpA family protein [Spirochaetota bacterium]